MPAEGADNPDEWGNFDKLSVATFFYHFYLRISIFSDLASVP